MAESVKVSIFGSTGSIGVQALDVIKGSGGRLEVYGLSANSNVEVLSQQIAQFSPEVVVVGSEEMATSISERFSKVRVEVGGEGLGQVAMEADVALNAVVGFAGLRVTLGAIAGGKRVALANKESLVAAGPLVRMKLEESTSEIVPVDSEHAAIHQCLRGGSHNEVKRLILTSSGGPFRRFSATELEGVTVADALNHPTWKMGPKITVDSSTLMNKALEVIEAYELFDVTSDQIDVVVHPESIVHSLVEFVDGSQIAQISRPDMRLPIAYALNYPERVSPVYGGLSYSDGLTLHFEEARRSIFRGLDFAYMALEIGDGAPTWLNAANEVAVDAFLRERIRWTDIYRVIEGSFESFEKWTFSDFESVLSLDELARRRASELVGSL
ncbi:MAG: 1-deoxy-D-xylulose-5-phosphate reductoisomerase [Actinomycetota bacterium]|nr:1-deoxy-D-xylulose-5-phosphate reductoisomerase [Actinomycetota bacterium]